MEDIEDSNPTVKDLDAHGSQNLSYHPIGKLHPHGFYVKDIHQ